MTSDDPMPCPNDDTLAALVHHALVGDEADRVTSHLDGCATCQQLVVAAVRGGVAITQPGALGTPSLPVARGAPLPIGVVVGRYTLRGLLGAGGMGHVYEAWDSKLERAIALKVLRPELAGAATLSERLIRESRIMAKLAHASVITIYDVGRAGDVVFIAMELVRGPTLAAYVASARPTWREIVGLFEQAGAGLAAAHVAGVVHRDFKPDNVLLGPAHQIVVTDFGIARATSSIDDLTPTTGATVAGDVRLTATGTAVGTPAYMSPEQLDCKVVDARADVFSFCVSLWEALFGARPFAGGSMDAIRAAMKQRPMPPHGGVPGRLVRALERGLAIDPDERWPDMTPLLGELAAVRRRRTHVAAAASAAGLVGLGIAGALLLGHTAPVDWCGHQRSAFDTAYRRAALDAALASDPATRELVLGTLDASAVAWRTVHAATCDNEREPMQSPTTTACLEARRLELAGYVEDTIADGPSHARGLSAVIRDPAACKIPALGLLVARVPTDPVLRRKVTALRMRALDAEAARDRADYTAALAAAKQLVDEAATLWPIVHAEMLLLYGGTQSKAGDSPHAIQTLTEAAGVAQSARDDLVAAKTWTELAMTTTFDQGDPAHGLEYVTYAEAALARIGNPPAAASHLAYIKGTTLTQANRTQEAEPVLQRAITLARQSDPDGVSVAIQGLGFMYQQEGRYAEAAGAYRQALAALPATGPNVVTGQVIYREQLAGILFNLGEAKEGEAMAREAVAIADRSFDQSNAERYTAHLNLAEVLAGAGKFKEALAEARVGVEGVGRTRGTRTGPYGEALRVEANTLTSLARFAEAEPLAARACEIIAFRATEDSTQYGACQIQHLQILGHLDRDNEALAICNKVLPMMVAKDGEPNPEVANAAYHCGVIHADVGDEASARALFERALATYTSAKLESGYAGQARWSLAKLLWRHDPERARKLMEQAVADFKTSTAGWDAVAESARTWLAEHPHR